VVIKSFKKEKLLQRPDLQQKLKQEWDIHTALLDHPNIIQAYLATEDDSSVGLFMEYAGEGFGGRVGWGGALSWGWGMGGGQRGS